MSPIRTRPAEPPQRRSAPHMGHIAIQRRGVCSGAGLCRFCDLARGLWPGWRLARPRFRLAAPAAFNPPRRANAEPDIDYRKPPARPCRAARLAPGRFGADMRAIVQSPSCTARLPGCGSRIAPAAVACSVKHAICGMLFDIQKPRAGCRLPQTADKARPAGQRVYTECSLKRHAGDAAKPGCHKTGVLCDIYCIFGQPSGKR